ncbi:MAG: hypothetical protein KBT21_07220 [Treponema sp.]|nr:hypothetical protein [Candidatus Treponema merdequi]
MKKEILMACGIFLAAISLNITLSCSRKTETETVSISEKIITTHDWYYLKAGGFEKISSPTEAPLVIKKPYTESIRISCFGQLLSNSDSNENSQKAFALVNRTGLIEFDKEKPVLHTDALLFKNVTADGLVFMNENPVFSVYKNDFFNEYFSTEKKGDSVLIQFDRKADTFFPLVTRETLSLSGTAEVNDYYWDGKYFYYCIKDSKKDKTDFNYIKWNSLSIKDSSEEEFRKLKSFSDYKNAPERVKKLLSCLPSSFNFSIEVRTASGPSPRWYEKKSADSSVILDAKLQLSDTFAACLFQDGTIYFAGALTNRYILNNANTLAIRLPKLPEGFIYTDFAISEDVLYASWEEASFYETGRAGFLGVDLAQVLYSELN